MSLLRRRLALLALTCGLVAIVLVVCVGAVPPMVFVLVAVLGAVVVYFTQVLAVAWERTLERRRLGPIPAGAESLLGDVGLAVQALDPVGRVQVHGEIWRARSATGEPIPPRSPVRVVGCEGLVLSVERTEPAE